VEFNSFGSAVGRLGSDSSRGGAKLLQSRSRRGWAPPSPPHFNHWPWSLKIVIDDHAAINSWSQSVIVIEVATQCSAVDQATLVGHCAGNCQCGWIVGRSGGRSMQVKEAITLQLGIRLQILARPPIPRSLSQLTTSDPRWRERERGGGAFDTLLTFNVGSRQ